MLYVPDLGYGDKWGSGGCLYNDLGLVMDEVVQYVEH